MKTTDGDPEAGLRKPELLSPTGDAEAFRAAVAGGADAVYLGFSRFNARRRARNFDGSEFAELAAFAHAHGVKVYITLNILILEKELPELLRAASEAAASGADGFIVQDYGAARLFRDYFPRISLHASTQMTTYAEEQISFLSRFGFSRINLARELPLREIKNLSAAAHGFGIETETFVHGAYCAGYSGQCLFSSWLGGQSGNRGMCFQPCRRRWHTLNGVKFPFSLKDNGAMMHAGEIIGSGTDSLKIEGRMKGPAYVQKATAYWRNRIDADKSHGDGDRDGLSTIFNRGYHDGYCTGRIGADMFVSSPLDRSKVIVGEIVSFERAGTTPGGEEIAVLAVAPPGNRQPCGSDPQQFQDFSTGPELSISTEENRLIARGTADPSSGNGRILFRIRERFGGIRSGQFLLHDAGNRDGRDEETKRRYMWENWKRSATADEPEPIRQEAGSYPTAGGEPWEPVPGPRREHGSRVFRGLAALIDDPQEISSFRNTLESGDLLLFEATHPDVFPPDSDIIPWFPAIMRAHEIGLWNRFLPVRKPPLIITGTSAVTDAAAKAGIPWIAGTGFNVANSAAAEALMKTGGAAGIMLSEELSTDQARDVCVASDGELWVKIYGPVLLMTTRTCPAAVISDCPKTITDEACHEACERSFSLTNEAHDSIRLIKRARHYPETWAGDPVSLPETAAGLRGYVDRLYLDLRKPARGPETGSLARDERLSMPAYFRDLAVGGSANRAGFRKLPRHRTCFPYGLS